jgi:hypothetical protein
MLFVAIVLSWLVVVVMLADFCLLLQTLCATSAEPPPVEGVRDCVDIGQVRRSRIQFIYSYMGMCVNRPQGAPEGKTVAGQPCAGSVVEKLRAAWERKAPPRSFDSAPQALYHAIGL